MPPKPQHDVHGIDASNAAVTIDYDKCMGCGMCAKTCTETQCIGALGKSDPKQPPTIVALKAQKAGQRALLDQSACVGCGQCTHACSFGAIVPTTRVPEVLASKLVKVAVIAPSTRVGISEAMGMPPGTSGEAQLVAGLRQLGFKYVFDNQWGADATTIEDAKEVLHMRAHKIGPCYTSCCPAWINLVETQYPELIPKISTSRSPHGIICSTIKKHWVHDVGLEAEDILVVGFMPCTAKKMEAARPALATGEKQRDSWFRYVQDCDISVTTKELAQLFKEAGLTFSEEREKELRQQKEGQFDAPFDKFSGSAYIFGKTAGVTEAVVRYVFAIKKEPLDMSKVRASVAWEHTDKIQNIKVLEFDCAGETYRAAVAHGGAAVRKCIEMEKELKCDVIEIMMCPMGCQNGGGQPRQPNKDLIPKRAEALDKHDKESKFADCESNSAMHEYIKKHMATEHDIHEVFHTHYENRKGK